MTAVGTVPLEATSSFATYTFGFSRVSQKAASVASGVKSTGANDPSRKWQRVMRSQGARATVNEALALLSTWERAVRNQATRVLGSPPDRQFGVSEKADGYLFVLALRNVIRAANLVLTLAPEHARPGIEAGIATFESKMGAAKDTRDVLDHFDDYVVGDGKLQKGSGRPMYVEWQERDGTTVRLCIGISSGRPLLSIDVLLGQLAAFELRGVLDEAVYEALKDSGGL